MKLRDFLSIIDCDLYNVYVGCLELGYSCVGTDSFNQEWVDYEVKSIEILSYASYQVNLIPPKKPWVTPDYVIGALVGVNTLSRGCYTCANQKIEGKCADCYSWDRSYTKWKNMFIKEG